MAQMKVFVSHSHQNNDFCAELVRPGATRVDRKLSVDNPSGHWGRRHWTCHP